MANSGWRLMGGPSDGAWTGDLPRQADGLPPREVYTAGVWREGEIMGYTAYTCTPPVHVYRWGSGSYWYVGEKR